MYKLKYLGPMRVLPPQVARLDKVVCSDNLCHDTGKGTPVTAELYVYGNIIRWGNSVTGNNSYSVSDKVIHFLCEKNSTKIPPILLIKLFSCTLKSWTVNCANTSGMDYFLF